MLVAACGTELPVPQPLFKAVAFPLMEKIAPAAHQVIVPTKSPADIWGHSNEDRYA